jgi:hypothetical protein
MRLIRITDLANAGEAKSEGIRKLRSYAEEKINPGMLKKKAGGGGIQPGKPHHFIKS